MRGGSVESLAWLPKMLKANTERALGTGTAGGFPCSMCVPVMPRCAGHTCAAHRGIGDTHTNPRYPGVWDTHMHT